MDDETVSLYSLTMDERNLVGDYTPYLCCAIPGTGSVAEALYAETDDCLPAMVLPPMVLWTEKRVYFTVQYDGELSVRSVPRDPTSELSPEHFGK